MQTRQIPESEWPAFLNRFSSRHQGWMVNLEILGSDLGVQMEGTWLLFEGLTDEWNERRGNTIVIMARTKPLDHLTHWINRPTEISVEKMDTGEDVALSIKADDGTRTLLILPTAR